MVALPSPPPPLLFLANGTGEVAVALSLTFVPAAVFSTPVVRGVEVLKVVQLYDAVARAPTGPALRAVPLGSVVTVTLQVTTPDELDGLLVEDWLPAGLRGVDPNVAGDSNDELRPFWMRYSAGGGGGAALVRADDAQGPRVVLRAVGAAGDAHAVVRRWPRRAASLLPPAKAAVTLQPVMGLSAGGALRVVPSPQSAEPLPAPAVPKGTRRLLGPRRVRRRHGRCRCDSGVGGAAYDTTVVPTSLGGADAVHARSKSAVDVDVSVGRCRRRRNHVRDQHRRGNAAVVGALAHRRVGVGAAAERRGARRAREQVRRRRARRLGGRPRVCDARGVGVAALAGR